MYGYQGYGYQPNYQQQNYMQRGYAPQPSQMPQNQTQVFTPIQTPPPAETPIQDIKFVNRAQAEAYIVFPNTKVMLIDTENRIAHIKTADGMGQTQTDYFRFEAVNADGSPIKPQEVKPEFNPDNFVTVEKFNELSAKFSELKKMISAKPSPAKPTETKV